MTEEGNLHFKNAIVLDAGPIIDYLSNAGIVDIIQKYIIDNKEVTKIIISPITLTEIFYVLCRQKDEKFASEKVNELKKSVKVELEFNLRELAGKYKCKRAISLADCYVLATAKLNSATAVFKPEEEILKEVKKKQFDVKLVMIGNDRSNK